MRTTGAAFAAVLLAFVLAVPASGQAPAEPAQGQGQGGRGGRQGQGGQEQGQTTGSLQRPRQTKPSGPTPRNADGRAFLGTTPTDKGVWTPQFSIVHPLAPNLSGTPDDAEASIPFQPWSKALYDARKDYQFEPHTRCKPSGFARQFITPYGVEFVELPQLDRMYIFDIGGPHSYRTIYMDGRPHPEHLEPSYYGHSIGWWEGDTLVVDTIGYNDSFWMDRRGVPHTERLHTLERFTRTNHDTLQYHVTVDDPGAFTKPWDAQFNLRWDNGVELFEYVCQQENIAAEDMASEFKVEDKVNPPIIP